MIVLWAIVLWIISLLVQAAALYLAAKWTGNETPFKALLVIALICSLCFRIPVIGFFVSVILMFILLVKICRMSPYPDALLTVLIS